MTINKSAWAPEEHEEYEALLAPAEVQALFREADVELDLHIEAARELVDLCDDPHEPPILIARRYAANGLGDAAGLAAMAVLRLAGQRRSTAGTSALLAALMAVLAAVLTLVLGPVPMAVILGAYALGVCVVALLRWVRERRAEVRWVRQRHGTPDDLPPVRAER